MIHYLTYLTSFTVLSTALAQEEFKAYVVTPPDPQDAVAKAQEWINKSVLERVLAYDWSKESYLLLLIGVYVVLHYTGVAFNKKKAEKWINGHQSTLASQFFQVGTNPSRNQLYVKDSPDVYTTYATGRTNVKSLTARLSLKKRHNLITLSLEYIIGFFFNGEIPQDKVEITIVPSESANIDNFVFAIVNKSIMTTARDDTYYLSLTKTTDSAKLPPYLVFMTESGEISDSLYSKELDEAVQNSESIIQLLAITDQPADRPRSLADIKPTPRIQLTLSLATSASDIEVSNRLIDAAINFVDAVSAKGRWRPEIAKKVYGVREAELKKIQKLLDEAKSEELAKKKADAKREQKDNISKLSPAEQRKIEQKERDKEQRKLRNKQTKRS